MHIIILKLILISIKRGVMRGIIKDESAQGAAEYILIFGGVIVVAIVALVIYRSYFKSQSGIKACQDIPKVRGSVK